MSRLFLPFVAAIAVGSVVPGQSFVERMDKRFAKQSPTKGEPLPAAAGFTMDGKPFRLEDLRGKPTVLVTGCLT